MLNGPNIAIFTGHFGSGKTEMAINYALKSTRQGKKTVLVDLDIVNPFYRSAEVKPMLEEEGIEVITPNFANTTMDIPSIPADVYSVFTRENTNVIFDVGGDEDGATALGGFNRFFVNSHYKMYFVINTKRPFTENSQDIITIMNEVEQHSRLKITDLVNNSNLSYETTPHIIVEGQKIIEDVSKEKKLPITYIGIKKDLVDKMPKEFQDYLFIIDLFMQPKF